MKVFEKIKNDIAEINNSFDMMEYLEKIKPSAILYCKEKYKDGIVEIDSEVKLLESGMINYLNSEIDNWKIAFMGG